MKTERKFWQCLNFKNFYDIAGNRAQSTKIDLEINQTGELIKEKRVEHNQIIEANSRLVQGIKDIESLKEEAASDAKRFQEEYHKIEVSDATITNEKKSVIIDRERKKKQLQDLEKDKITQAEKNNALTDELPHLKVQLKRMAEQHAQVESEYSLEESKVHLVTESLRGDRDKLNALLHGQTAQLKSI